MLFQRAASVSTSPVMRKGQTDQRIQLQVLSTTEAGGHAQTDTLALFLGVEPSEADAAGWGDVRIWGVPEAGSDHGSLCVCCQTGGQLGRLLIGLMQERARGTCGFFKQIDLICLSQDKPGLIQSLQADPLVSSLYALKPTPSRFSCDY